MVSLVLNLILYISFVVFLIYKNKGVSVNAAIFIFYALIALFGVLIYDTPYYNWGYYNHLIDHTRNVMSFAPLFFVFICFIIYYKAVSGVNTVAVNGVSRLPKVVENGLFVFSVCFLFFFLFKFKDLYFAVSDYASAYSDGVNLEKLGPIGKYVMTVELGFDTFFAIFPFYLFAKKNRGAQKKAVVLLTLFVLVCYVKASVIGSRGTIFFCVINVFFAYLMFKNMLSEKIDKMIKVGGIVILVLFVSLSIMISIARFGDTFFLSIASYFGEPFINFPLIFWNYPRFLGGDYLIYQLLGGQTPSTPIWMGYFRTMPGSVYVDFGILGTLLFFYVYATIFKKILGGANLKMTFSQMYVYAYLVFQMIYGVFGFNLYSLKVLSMNVLLYLLFRFTQTKDCI